MTVCFHRVFAGVLSYMPSEAEKKEADGKPSSPSSAKEGVSVDNEGKPKTKYDLFRCTTALLIASVVPLYFIAVGSLGFVDPSMASVLLANRGVSFLSNPVNCAVLIGGSIAFSTMVWSVLSALRDERARKQALLELGFSDL